MKTLRGARVGDGEKLRTSNFEWGDNVAQASSLLPGVRGGERAGEAESRRVGKGREFSSRA